MKTCPSCTHTIAAAVATALLRQRHALTVERFPHVRAHQNEVSDQAFIDALQRAFPVAARVLQLAGELADTDADALTPEAMDASMAAILGGLPITDACAALEVLTMLTEAGKLASALLLTVLTAVASDHPALHAHLARRFDAAEPSDREEYAMAVAAVRAAGAVATGPMQTDPAAPIAPSASARRTIH